MTADLILHRHTRVQIQNLTSQRDLIKVPPRMTRTWSTMTILTVNLFLFQVMSHSQGTDLNDDFLEHDCGGQIYDIEVEACPALHIQEKHHHDKGHPYHPWETANKVGVTNLVYAQAHMTMAATNKLLGMFKNGAMKMDGLGFHSSQAMHKILGAADYVPVCNIPYYCSTRRSESLI